jgi:serine/threonine protein kinase/tetratricopeptide (TPR) repeat protein
MRLCVENRSSESEAIVIETRQILEELQLKNVLATSSTGAVFLAGDPDRGRDVAIKMVSCAVPNAEDKVRDLFLEMAAAARSAPIQAMPALTDHGLTPEGDGFLVMELVEGQILDSIDDLTPFAAINILLDVLSCIEDLARAGAAHLNLTSANVFVTNAPANDRAKILGFGTSATLLHAGAGVPVPAVDPHLAPELVAGNLLPLDQAWRSDLFSFGVIACVALGAEIEADGYERPRVVLPDAVRSKLPEADPLEAILGKIMEPDPMKRGESPSELRDPLIRALPDPPAVAAAPAPVVVSPPEQRFDPNKTDPAFDPSKAAVLETEPSPDLPISGAETVMAAVAPQDEDGWPEVLFDDPELPASLDDADTAEDTDVRNPIPVDVWVPEAAAAGDAPAAVAPEVQQPSGARRVSPVELALVGGVVIILASIIAFTWPSVGDDDGPAVAAAVQIGERESTETLVPPPPDDNLFDDLLAIQTLVDADDLSGASDALNALDDGEGFSFSSDESALYDSLVLAVAEAADRGQAIEDLRTGLGYGSVKMLRRGVAGLSGMPRDEISEIDGLAEDLTRARRVLGLHADMWEAHKSGDYLRAVAKAGQLEDMFPGYTGAPDLKNQSAAALESQAEAFIARGEFENAVAILEDLREVWPGRAGSAARIAWCNEQIDLARREESMIAQALAKGEAGDPEAGLAILDRMSTDPLFQGDVDRARLVLESRIAELDAGEPVIEIAATMELGFKKNQTITVPLKVTDDYRVERVVVHARNESDDGYLQIPLEPAGDGLYHFVVAPELHANKSVSFYVVARDPSGHIGRFGSQDEPQMVVRKRWFKK